jgi:hypothetical protein
LTLERHQQANSVFEVPVSGGICSLPGISYAGDPQPQRSGVFLAELLIQIVVRIMPLGVRVRKALAKF